MKRVLLLLALVACDGGGAAMPRATTGYVAEVDGSAGEEPNDAGTQFIATRESFKGYLGWQSFFIGNNEDDSGVHVPGAVWVYINKMPAPGQASAGGRKTFPIGTIIVKAIKRGEPKDWQVFAMVKRGGDYNLLGAFEWEWFELAHLDEERFTIAWNGVKPPADAGYGGLGGGACNGCHANAAASNDYVLSPPLTLP